MRDAIPRQRPGRRAATLLAVAHMALGLALRLVSRAKVSAARVVPPFLIVMMLALPALAADVKCGIDTDLNGSVDQWCPSPDEDGDGETTVTDCDDNNYFIRDGVATGNGCSAGEFRTCNAGSYSACAPLSTYDPLGANGRVFWVDDAETDCSGDGSYADPENILCWADTGMSGYHAPVAGDVVVARAGTYNDTFSSGPVKHFSLSNTDGTATSPIWITAAPGETWWEAGVGNGVVLDAEGTSPNTVTTFSFSGSDHIHFSGWEVTHGASGFASGVLWFGAGTGGKAFNNYIHDIGGECGSANCAALYAAQGQTAVEFHHNFTGEVIEDADPTNQNTADVVIMDCDDFDIHHHVCLDDGGYCIKIKHAIGTSTLGGRIEFNTTEPRTRHPFIGLGGHPYTEVRNNFQPATATTSCIDLSNLGDSDCKWEGIVVEENTCQTNGSKFGLNIDDSLDTIGTAPAVTFRNNVIISARSSGWSSNGDGGGEIMISHYKSDTNYTDLIGGGKLVIEDNCFYNPNGIAFLGSIFGNNQTLQTPLRDANGNVYTSWATWTAAGWDAGSANENPTLDAYGRATSSNCDDKGWLPLSAPGPTPTPTPTPTPAPPPIVSNDRTEVGSAKVNPRNSR